MKKWTAKERQSVHPPSVSDEKLLQSRDGIKRFIKYQSQLDQTFGPEIARVAHGENIFNCIQCGTCSATCPVAHYMDYTPRRIIAMLREGFKEEILKSFTIWLCASCYSCTVDCPRKIRITDVMYALKQRAIEEGAYPRHFPIPVLAEEFFRQVMNRGRNSEGRLMLALAFKTNPLRLLKYAKVGWKLFRNGRAPLRAEGIENRESLRTLLQAVERAKEEMAR